MKNMLNQILLISSLVLTQLSFAQMTISGGSDFSISEKKEASKVEIEIDERLSTSSSNQYRSKEEIEIFAFRNDTKIELALEFHGEKRPKDVIIERKTSEPLAEFRLVKTFTNSQIDSLYINKRIVMVDDFPTSRKLSTLYRVEFKNSEDITKVLPPVLLKGQSTQSEGLTGIHEKDASYLFAEGGGYSEYSTYGLTFTAERDGSVVNVKLTNEGNFDFEGEWIVERKTSEYLSSYRKIKTLSKEDIAIMNSRREFVYIDKYPKPQKVTSYYRLVYIRKSDGHVFELAAAEIPRSR